jgi:3-oxo-5alpha-steroid 4-dehydrogenase
MTTFEPLREREIPAWEREVDVAIVGLGCAGASAAIEAVQAGAETLVLECASGGGGTSANSGGLIYMGGGTPLQKACGFDDTPEEMFRYLMAACGPAPDERLVGPFCEHSVEHYHWFEAQGLRFKPSFFPDAHEPPGDDSLTYSGSEDVYPFCEMARPAPRGHCASVVGPKGALLMQTLIGAGERAGARLLPDARCEHLVLADDGRVVGVAALVDGMPLRVRARRGVVLSAGGFIYDDEMLARYAPRLTRFSFKIGTPHDDGSGVRMGAAAGGATIRMDAADITLPLFPPVALKQGLYVNRFGQRFLNEDAYMGRAGEFAVLQQDGHVFLIVDDACFGRPENVPVELAAVGETIAELEAELGITAPLLRQTVAFYNEHAARGEDPLFHKRPQHLRPLDRPPYGAIDLRPEAIPYAVFTLGGLQIDAEAAVLTPSGGRIPGLFAAGRTTSGISKQGYSSGISLGDASFFGRRAGRSAAAALST